MQITVIYDTKPFKLIGPSKWFCHFLHVSIFCLYETEQKIHLEEKAFSLHQTFLRYLHSLEFDINTTKIWNCGILKEYDIVFKWRYFQKQMSRFFLVPNQSFVEKWYLIPELILYSYLKLYCVLFESEQKF